MLWNLAAKVAMYTFILVGCCHTGIKVFLWTLYLVDDLRTRIYGFSKAVNHMLFLWLGLDGQDTLFAGYTDNVVRV
ncbi:CGH_1_HP_G0103900.mRNA.1.CDS.1 [Saccharomyces cerevisiae]|nr:CGH_1_HP_G0103900.mRNA.1.CDS.1 [Saccharomyces cerevisiae]CAI6951095.1 CGH_1_HP_G0103900.mRNA.1.CDS.1 [Saccharomyces cerevisiae]